MASIPGLPALIAGSPLTIKAHVACGASPTISVNGGSAIGVKRDDGVALSASDLLLNGVYELKYDGTSFYCQTKLPSQMGATFISADSSVSYASGEFGFKNITIPTGATMALVQCQMAGSAYPEGMIYAVGKTSAHVAFGSATTNTCWFDWIAPNIRCNNGTATFAYTCVAYFYK